MPINVALSMRNESATPLDDKYNYDTIVDRDAIPAGERPEGLQVYVAETGLIYYLKGGIDNANWTESGGSSAGGGVLPKNILDTPVGTVLVGYNNIIRYTGGAYTLEAITEEDQFQITPDLPNVGESTVYAYAGFAFKPNGMPDTTSITFDSETSSIMTFTVGDASDIRGEM